MSRDRLATLLRVRELLERRRLAEQADARRSLQAAETAHARASEAVADAAVPAGTALEPAVLVGHRAGTVSLMEAHLAAADRVQLAAREQRRADERTVRAAVERRSAERLVARRAELTRRQRDRHERNEMDELGLQAWRRDR